jgi:hypothetical protein
MIARMNRIYAATYSGFPDTTGAGTYIPYQFVLAQRDPSCASTNGITRDNGNSVAGYTNGGVSSGSGSCPTCPSDVTVKNVNRWDVNQYLNIWVVNKIDSADGTVGSFTAGYAYIPPGTSANVDGVIILATQVTVTTPLTCAHEVGHHMGLYHPFDGGSTTACPSNANCLADNDKVCDTEPIKQFSNCPADPNPCTGSSFNGTQHNIMCYSSCQDRFTKGQRVRSLFALLTYRPDYTGSLGATPTSIAVGSLSSCTPTSSNPSNTLNAGPTEVKITDLTDTTFGAINTYLDHNTSGYNGDGNAVFLDLTCKQGTTLIAGKTYLFSITTGYSSSTHEKIRVYIDFNNNGTFDASELVMSKDATATHQTDTAQVTIPTTSTFPALVSCTPLRMRVISDVTSGTINPCGPLAYGQAEDYMVIIQGGGATTGSLSISLPPGANPSCSGTSLTFHATAGSGVSSATYKWFVNGTFNGVTADSFVSSTLTNGTTVYAKVYYPGACGSDSAISNTITVLRSGTLAPTNTIALTTGNNPGCAGRSTTFTAYPTSGGTSPTYQWQLNTGLGFTNVGTNSPTYTAVLNAGDILRCILTSSASCASPKTATSNSITIQHYHIVADVRISADSFPSCANKPVVFHSVSINAGAGPTYQWYVNGSPIAGATNNSYLTTTLSNGDSVYCVMTCPDSCVLNHTVYSNVIYAIINSPSVPSASVAITQGSNPGCLDSVIQFVGSATNVGAGAQYTWYVNGLPVYTGNVFTTATLKNGDIVQLKVIITDQGCYTADTAIVAPITMVLSPTPPPPIISLIGNMLVSNIPGTLEWFGPPGFTQISGESAQAYHPTIEGYYYARIINNGCASPPSNILGISLLNINSYNLSQVKIYPNPTSGQLTFDWESAVNMKFDVYSSVGKLLLHDVVVNQIRKVLDLSFLANGNYFVVLTTADGKMATVPVTLKK